MPISFMKISNDGISAPTLRKHYFANGKVNRKSAKALAIREVKGRTLLQLDKAAEDGKVAAIKAIRSIVEREELVDLPKVMQPSKPSRSEPKGKKERLVDAAKQPSGDWETVLPGLDRPN